MDKKISNNWQLWSFIVILTIWGLTFVIWSFNDWTPAQKGQFGDIFGAANALFSGFALWGLIITIRQQNQSIQIQNKEVEGAKADVKAQIDIIEKQRFENTFFQMLSLHHQIVDTLNYSIPIYDPTGLVQVDTQETEKREVLKTAAKDLLHQIYRSNREYFNIRGNKRKRIKNSSYVIQDIDDSYKTLNSAYDLFYKRFESNLSHYYRNLYHIFKMIHESRNFLSEQEQRRYSSIVRAQLSHEEQFILYYNAMVDGLGNPKFLFLVKKYDLMQNFGPHQLKPFGNHEEIFNKLCDNVTEEHYEAETTVELTN